MAGLSSLPDQVCYNFIIQGNATTLTIFGDDVLYLSVQNLSVTIASNFQFSQQCINTVTKLNETLIFFRRELDKENRVAIFLSSNNMVTLHSEYVIVM